MHKILAILLLLVAATEIQAATFVTFEILSDTDRPNSEDEATQHTTPRAEKPHAGSPPPRVRKKRPRSEVNCPCLYYQDKSKKKYFEYLSNAHANTPPSGTAVARGAELIDFEHILIQEEHGNNPMNASCVMMSFIASFERMEHLPEDFEYTIGNILALNSPDEQALALRQLIWENYTIPVGASEELRNSLVAFASSNEALTPLILLPFLSTLFQTNITIFAHTIDTSGADLDSSTTLELVPVKNFPYETDTGPSDRNICLLVSNIDPESPSRTNVHIEPLIHTGPSVIRRLNFETDGETSFTQFREEVDPINSEISFLEISK